MMEIFKTVLPSNQVVKANEIEKGCWINLIAPTEQELDYLEKKLDILPNFLRDPLDEEEKPRIDVEDEQTLIIVDIPYVYEDEKNLIFETLPLGLLQVKDDYIITICSKETDLHERFKCNRIKGFFTFKKTRLILQFFYYISKDYLKYLRHIDKRTDSLEESLHKSMKNEELFKLLELEKSLVFFTTSLKSNEVVFERLLRGKFLKFYNEDQDLLEDVIIENKQALEMSSIYGSIVNNMMEAYSSVISNNLNNVMKFLTSVTIVLSIPTMIFSFYGMNVNLPFQSNGFAFMYLLVFSVVIAIIGILMLSKKKMF